MDGHLNDSRLTHVVVVVASLSAMMILGLLHYTEIGTSLVGGGLGAMAAGVGLRGRGREDRDHHAPVQG